jgi:phage gp36-like protein
MSTAYATRTDLTSLGLPSAALTNVSTTAQDAALLSASARADSYLKARFTLPLTAWGQDLTEAVCHIAAWTILSARGFNPDQGADTAIRTRYEDAIRWLERIADDRATPTVTDSSTSVGGGGTAPRVYSSTARGW